MKLNLGNLKLELRTFYLIGAILMVFSIIGSIWALCENWSILVWGARLSSFIGVLFNALWMGLFAFMYKMTPAQPQKVINDPELDNFIKDLQSKDKMEVKDGKN